MNKYFAILLLILVGFTSCVSFKQQALFDAPSDQPKPKGIGNFYSLNIYDNNLSSEVWFTQAPKCLTVENTQETAFSGNASMLWKWDKKAADCPWMGIGFGWDGWAPKDISQILDKAAIQLKVKSVNGNLGALPLAASLEDYSGSQAWLGLSSNAIRDKVITDTGWTTVLLPFAEFDWNENNANYYNIKQLIIQFEASGAIYVDEIQVVPFEGSFLNRYTTVVDDEAGITIDGKADDPIWSHVEKAEVGKQTVQLCADDKNLYAFIQVKDDSPLVNKRHKENIWNGDAFEIAFATDPSVTIRRNRYRSTDRHIGISMSENTEAWDWTRNVALENVATHIEATENGYKAEIAIPLASLDIPGFIPNAVYGVEFAIDLANEKGNRTKQERWNSAGTEGFNNNPKLWGELVFRTKNNL
ncbi:MAG: sugar-binding protein [Salinivirgaceae bacterium]